MLIFSNPLKLVFSFLFFSSSCLVFAAELASLDYVAGKALFEKTWIPAPASATASDGLGPYYNARSCHQCHPGGGRGDREKSLVILINDAVYGRQLQRYALPGLLPEASYSVSVKRDKSNDPTPFPIKFTNLQYGALENDDYSARIAPSLHGLGLLALIPESWITARADEQDEDGDGISGRINWLENDAGASRIGRFGWKASQESLSSQVARALSLDLGIGNPLLPSASGDCTPGQIACLQLPDGNSAHHDGLEANQVVIELLLTYIRELPTPAEIDFDQTAHSRGNEIFTHIGCDACHVPAIILQQQLVTPYTDLLLHDMGPYLADRLTQGLATGNEWRTAPLWRLGRVSGGFLHDGRAESIHEAVLWHAGEANKAVQRYLSLSDSQRNDLIVFLNSL